MSAGRDTIRVRACLAVVREGRVLLAAHCATDGGAVQWLIPGGGVEYGEALALAACREFTEETGLRAECGEVLDVSEVIIPQRPWHSVSVVFRGSLAGGELAPETHAIYGKREARWFASADLAGVAVHPERAVRKALGLA